MLRIGVDMVEVERIRAGVERFGERFLARFFTPTEREQSREVPARLAARFAAKEAAAKALGTGIGDVSWVDIEIESDARGRPHLKLHNTAAVLAAELGLHEWQVSLTHTHEHAIAFVVALSNKVSERGDQ
jgi:holo-[acyl-carrier protein] synthase